MAPSYFTSFCRFKTPLVKENKKGMIDLTVDHFDLECDLELKANYEK